MRKFIICLLFFAALSAPAAPWTQEVYVWQRQSSPALTQALDAARPFVAGFQFLGAEVSWSGGKPQVFRPDLDFAKLAKLGRPVGLVLRIGPYPGPFLPDDVTAQALASLASSLLASARAGGLTPGELQIDFDCAEARLDGYRVWLGALRQAAGKTSLVFTALPVWLRHPAEFSALAHVADGFVLQVHSLDKPTSPNSPFTLCDPAQVRVWSAQAGQVGVPFRLALPTYGYLVAFDSSGKFFALAAEGQPPDWPQGTQVRSVRSDAVALAQLAQALAKAPPPHCQGLIWFRLPVAGDRLNWDFSTLQVILQNGLPVPQLTVAVNWPEPGLAEISVVNTGQITEPPPAQVSLQWPVNSPPQAADALGGFRLDLKNAENQAVLLNANAAPGVFLVPGSRLPIAWLRFAHATPLDAKIIAPAP